MSRVQQAPLLGAVALVTGAGIGQAVAVELARCGAATVIIADLTTSKLTKTAEQIRRYGVDAVPVALDVADRTGLEDLAHLIGQRYGAVAILVNNAGIGIAGRLRDTSSTDWDRILAVSLRSVIDATTVFGSQMAARGRGGYVLNLASAAAFLPSKAMVAYTTTKGAVLAFTESARADLADARIQVSAVCPGFVNTDIAATTIYAGATAEQQQRSRARAARATDSGTTRPRRPRALLLTPSARTSRSSLSASKLEPAGWRTASHLRSYVSSRASMYAPNQRDSRH